MANRARSTISHDLEVVIGACAAVMSSYGRSPRRDRLRFGIPNRVERIPEIGDGFSVPLGIGGRDRPVGLRNKETRVRACRRERGTHGILLVWAVTSARAAGERKRNSPDVGSPIIKKGRPKPPSRSHPVSLILRRIVPFGGLRDSLSRPPRPCSQIGFVAGDGFTIRGI